MIINWSLDAMIDKAANIYKNHPIILVSAKNLRRDALSFLSKHLKIDITNQNY